MASAVPAAPRAAPSLTSPSPMPLVSTRADPQHQRNSAMDVQRDSTMDVKMADGDDDPLDDVSDADSATSESHRPSRKKKKGQRFFCTDYPPCQLSFTRSEHLARHIRKHTGERPFQCHCSRRFSRLDNLRQHAHTVHVNEDIPDGSLATSAPRFVRPIRTDRPRPTTSRSRASTLGSTCATPTSHVHPHARTHVRNPSTSSITSTASSTKGGGTADDRRRQLSFAMAAHDRHPSITSRPLSETYASAFNSSSARGSSSYYHSPGYSTPQSGNGPASPGAASAMGSPPSALLRSVSLFNTPRHNRRLSVPVPVAAGSPSAATPTHHTSAYQPTSYLSPPLSYSSHHPSTVASPTASAAFSPPTRRDSEAELEFRRRTWHPSTHSAYSSRPATSGLSYQTPRPSSPRPPLALPPTSPLTHQLRLPGIESFDRAPLPPSSPMQLDPSPAISLRPLSLGTASSIPERPGDARPDSLPSASTPRTHKRQGWYGGPLAPIPSATATAADEKAAPRVDSAYQLSSPSASSSSSSSGLRAPPAMGLSMAAAASTGPTMGPPDDLARLDALVAVAAASTSGSAGGGARAGW